MVRLRVRKFICIEISNETPTTKAPFQLSSDYRPFPWTEHRLVGWLLGLSRRTSYGAAVATDRIKDARRRAHRTDSRLPLVWSSPAANGSIVSTSVSLAYALVNWPSRWLLPRQVTRSAQRGTRPPCYFDESRGHADIFRLWCRVASRAQRIA